MLATKLCEQLLEVRDDLQGVRRELVDDEVSSRIFTPASSCSRRSSELCRTDTATSVGPRKESRFCSRTDATTKTPKSSAAPAARPIAMRYDGMCHGAAATNVRLVKLGVKKRGPLAKKFPGALCCNFRLVCG